MQRRAVRFAVPLAILTVTLGIALERPSISSDPAFGILAAEQRLSGGGNTLQQINTIDPQTWETRREAITWWAPGVQHVLYALRLTGLSLGASIRFLVMGCWLLGIWAWARWFGLTATAAWAPVVLIAFSFFRASHYNGFTFLG